MLVVKLELWPANPAKPHKTLGVMRISNQGGLAGDTTGNYKVAVDSVVKEDWKTGEVLGFPRTRLHAWHLVARALKAAGIK